jgi:hypothetical protein
MCYWYDSGSFKSVAVEREVFTVGDDKRSLYIAIFFFLFCIGIIILRVSWPPPRFHHLDIFRGGVISPTPSPQSGEPGTTLLMALPGAYAPASIALCVTGAHRPPLHGKAIVLEKHIAILSY